MDKNEQNVAILNYILLSYEFLEAIDKVMETKYYKQKVKNLAKSLLQELEKTSAIHEITGLDDESLYVFMREKEKLMRQLATVRPELKAGLAWVQEEFLSDPIGFLNRNQVDVIDV